MLNHLMITRLACMPALLLLLAVITSQHAQAQQQNQEQSQKQETIDVTLPPDREMLRLRVVAPGEVRVNQSFDGRIEISNLSEHIAFHDIKIGQLADSGLSVESSRVSEAKSGEPNKDAAKEEKGAKEKNAAQKSQQNGQQKNNAQKNAQSNAQQQEKYSQVWTIDRLDPGQTRSIHFTASSSQQGELKSCLALVSMTPSLCLSTRFVEPELEIVKQGPDQVNVCEPIVYHYSVKNSGSGEIESFTIYDELAEGLKTLEGSNELRFQVDGLKAGDVRKFSAKLVSTKSGEFQSRAAAKSKSGDEARSNNVTTRVVEPQLALAIDGPDAVYVNRPATYTVRVSNHGQGRADRARVVLRFPQALSVANVSEPWDSERMVDSQEQSQQSQTNEQQPTAAKQDGSQPTNSQSDNLQAASSKSNNQQSNQRGGQSDPSPNRQRDLAEWKLGELAPGQTKAMRITLNTHGGGAAELEAEALAWCGSGDEAQQVAKLSKSQRTEIISLPALALAVVDLEDPVATDDKVTYRVTVRNEGTAADNNIRVRVTLPKQLQFEKATGPTKGQADGNEVTFQPVKQLGAGEEVSWRLETKAAERGEVALRATLESEGLGRTVKAEEPTTLFAADGKGESKEQNESSNASDASKRSDAKAKSDSDKKSDAKKQSDSDKR